MNDLITHALQLGAMATALSTTDEARTPHDLSAELQRQALAWKRYARLGAPRCSDPVAERTPARTSATAEATFSSYGSALQKAAASSDVAIAMLAKTSLDRILHTGFTFPLLGDQLAGIPASLTVDSVLPSGREAVEITLRLPAVAPERYIGRAGQYVTLHTEIAGVPLRRSYSLCRPPRWTEDTQQLVIGVRAHPKGTVSKHLVYELKAGDQVLVAPPNGSLTFSDEWQPRSCIVLIGVGSGVTPLVALAAEALTKDSTCKVSMLVVERSTDDMMLSTVFSELTADPRFELVIVPTRGPDSSRRPDREKFAHLLRGISEDLTPGQGLTSAYLCGPTAVLNEAVSACLAVGIDEAFIHQETFQNHAPLDLPPRPGGTVFIELGSDSHIVEARPGETLLAAALRSGAEVGYSCLAGSCGTCAVRVTEGVAGPQSPEVLGQQKTANGWVLACMAAPLGEPALVQG